MTTSNYTAPQTEDEQSEEDREALDQYDPTLVPTMSGALVPEMNRTFAEAQALGDGSYQHDTHAIPDEDA